MGNNYIMLAMVAAIAVAFYIFSGKSKKTYPESKVKETLDLVDGLLKVQDYDHGFIVKLKGEMHKELQVVRKQFCRTPSVYTQEEIDHFEKLLPELKYHLRECCKNLINMKFPLIDVIEAEKKLLQQIKETINSTVHDESESYEDVMDIYEKILESSPVKIKEKEQELMKLEQSILKYQFI